MLAASDSNLIILVMVFGIILCTVILSLLAVFILIIVSIKRRGKLSDSEKKVPPSGRQNPVSHTSSEAVSRKETLKNTEFLIAQLCTVEDNNCHKETAPPVYEMIPEGNSQPRNPSNREHLTESDYIHNNIVLTNENLNSVYNVIV